MDNQDNKNHTEQETQEPPFHCPFVQTKCNATFKSQEDWKLHISSCFRGVLLSCRVPKCMSGSQPLIFNNPRELIDHAVAVHKCLFWSRGVTEKLRVTFPDWFLRPQASKFAAIILRRLTAKMDNMELDVGLIGLVKENSPDGSPTKFFLIPVQMDSVNATSDHLIQLRVQINGRNNVVIPHFGRWNPWMEEELPHGSVMNASCTLTVNHFKSVMDLLENIETNSIGSFSRDRILSEGIPNPNDKSVSVAITVRLEIVRCHVTRNTSNAGLKEFAIGWDEIGFRDIIRSTVGNPDITMPSTATRILFPQLIAKKSLLIESLYEYQIMNAIGPLILDSLMFEKNISSLPSPCKLILIMPNRTYIEGSIDGWNKWAAIKKLRIYQMVDTKSYFIDQFKIHGGDIMMITFSAFNDAVNLNDRGFWSLMTKDLRNVHVHLPSCYPYPLANDVFIKFVEKLGDRIKSTQCTMFDHHISEGLSNDFFSHLFKGGAIQLSIGENPIGFLKRSISNVNCEPGQSKLNLTIRLIQMDGEASKRWIIFISKTMGPEYENLKTQLSTTFPLKRLSFLESDDIARDNPNHFLPFLLSQDGIMVASFSSLAFAELSAASRVIIYDRPNEVADFIRVVTSFKIRKQSTNTIYVLSQ